MDKLSSSKSFTLIELLVVIGILAILTAAVVVVLNPAEYLKQARDTTRMNDLGQINQALTVLESQGITSFGTANTVYVSIPDNASSTCGSLGLPTLPGYSYHCVTSANLQKIDSTGWIPVDFTQSTALAFSNLPLDPVNTTSTGNYYTYTPGGSWELDTILESSKYRLNAILSKTNLPGVYAKGSNLTLSPIYNNSGLMGYWGFNEGSGTTAHDSSGNGDDGTLSSPAPAWTSGKVGSGALSFNGTSNYVEVPSSSVLSPSAQLTLSAWMKWDGVRDGVEDWTTIIAKGSFGSGEYSVIFNRAPGFTYNQTRFYINGGNTVTWENFGGFDTGWHLLTFTYDGTNTKIYYDAGLVASGSYSSVITASANSLEIGRESTGDYRFGGLIDDVRVYNRALSVAEIQAIYNATK